MINVRLYNPFVYRGIKDALRLTTDLVVDLADTHKIMMLLILLLVVGAMAESDSGELRIFCGRELARVHALYCYGLDPMPEESEATTEKTPVLGTNDIGIPKIPDRFTHKLRRAAVKDLDISLIEACCVKPCHINDILKNC